MAAITSRAASKRRSLIADWHPLQFRCLTILFERPASPSEIGKIVGEPNPSTVSYHIRQLVKRGLVEEIGQRPGRRGSTEHFFKAKEGTAISGEEWAELSQSQREEYSEWTLQLWGVDLGLAVREGTLDADLERHLTRLPLQLDTQGWRDLLAAYMDLYDRAFAVQVESDERRAGTGERSKRITALLACFQMPPVEDTAL